MGGHNAVSTFTQRVVILSSTDKETLLRLGKDGCTLHKLLLSTKYFFPY